MIFLSIRHLLLFILTTQVNATKHLSPTSITSSFISSFAASSSSIVDGKQKCKRSGIFTSTKSMMMSSQDDCNDRNGNSNILQTTPIQNQQESIEPVNFNDNDGKQPQSAQLKQSTTRKRGRPGIVVFSGGTAFNAAAAEMAQRNVASVFTKTRAEAAASSSSPSTVATTGVSGLDDTKSDLSEDNSINDMMFMTSMMAMTDNPPSQSNNNSNNNAIDSGGIKVWHVLPVTDDGGSTAEIVRVLGGPAVGDIRSRLLRLAPGNTREGRAVRRLLGHRLVSLNSFKKRQHGGEYDDDEITAERISRMAREEWLDIIDGGMETNQQHYRHYMNDDDDDDEAEEDDNEAGSGENYEHPLWKDVSTPYRSIIRAFLIHFHSQVLQTHNGVRHSSKNPPFDFTGGSVGNFFFAGARIFFGSLPAAIFLFSKVAGIPTGSRVLPAVLSEERLVLGAVLKDGTRLRGQYEISHPSPRQLAMRSKSGNSKEKQRERSGSFKAVVKSFDSSDSLSEGVTSLHPSAISRVCYLLHDPTWRRKSDSKRHVYNSSDAAAAAAAAEPPSSPRLKSRVRTDWNDRHEIIPEPNPSVLEAISNANCLVYGCGSLFTSVLPSLVLKGVGEEIVRKVVPKVLLLNGWHDHETSWLETSSDGSTVVKQMDASSIVQTITSTFDRAGIMSGIYSASDFSSDNIDAPWLNDECNIDDEDDSHDSRGVIPIPLITDYITHIFYPIGCEFVIDELSLEKLCSSRQCLRSQHAASKCITEQQDELSPFLERIKVVGVPSIAADGCVEGKRSGGKSQHRIFEAGALVDALLELASE